jgi:predicted small lipoprotein YifL
MHSAVMSPSPSTERATRRRVALALLALLALAACGKRGELRLPTPEEMEQDDDPSQEDGPA